MKNFIFCVTMLCAAAAQATEWQAIGPKALAMGGAGVAVPQGAESAYWNPALLGLADNQSGLQVPVGAHLAISGTVLRGAKDLNQLVKDCSNGSANCTDANIQSALNEMNDPNNGVRGDVGGGLGLKFGRFSLFATNLTYVGAKPIMDLVNNTKATINANTSKLRLSGVSVTEFGAAYGHELPFLPGVDVGVALKGMAGRTGFEDVSVVTTDPGHGALNQFTKSTRDSVQAGVDAGLLWDVSRSFPSVWWQPRFGLSARDINNPQFKNTDSAIAAGLPSEIKLKSNVRGGFSISPLHFWRIALDGDLTRNATILDGVASRQVGIGTEINVFNRSWLNIPLRVGLAKNTAETGARTAITGGVGLNFLHVNVDLGVQSTPATEEIQSQGKTVKFPSELAVAGQFALLF
ncbi:MAG: conjugal transfer protein TraF [Elusimicrobia bacterium]|nr:conjugal transfer protein TraF [Elusimicrobiota bacterium]MDE2237422.1 conjugal transfer protein TraF [Elusimicrobiota bacterium]MDE2426873.1 conjugal transfer protein TraF [Elusimicrobiota bacterium]